MREIDVARITEVLKDACGRIACDYSPDIVTALNEGASNETDERSQMAMDMLLRNAEIAHSERIPICQDTGLAIVYLTVGQEESIRFCNLSRQRIINNTS